MKKVPCKVCGGDGIDIGTDYEAGHGCDGTDEVCQRICPVPVPVQVQVQCDACQATGWQLEEN